VTLPSRVAGALAKLPAAQTRQVAVERDLAVTMADGTRLLADRWYPERTAAGVPATVLLRSPYGRRQLGMVGRLFAERGYQVVIQSCRGTFGSGGRWVPMRNEQADGRSTLEWVAAQPWFDGRLVTFGPSYLGLTQWAVAEDAPAYLRAMALNVTASDFRPAVVYPGGSFALETSLAWLQQLAHQELGLVSVIRSNLVGPRQVRAAAAVLPLRDGDVSLVGRPVDFYQDWLAHDTPGDSWWDPIDFGRRLDGVPPSTLVAGWYDIFLPDQIADFQALRAAGRPVRLTIGKWTHASPGGFAMALRDGLEFFDEQLDGARARARARRSTVRLFVMGADRWEDHAEWPPPADRQNWYLGAAGRLSAEVPPEEAPPDRYRYDPADPTPGCGGPSLLAKSAGPKDQRPREGRGDVVLFTSAALSRPLTVIGPLTVALHVRSSLDEVDFFVRLCDVSPKGRSVNLSDGIVRLTAADLVRTDDGTFVVTIGLWPTANMFRAGHRIRLQVSSGAHPLFARNTGSGESLAGAAQLRASDVEIWHDARHPSCLVLPVVQ
jgi:putative CocE/NonD family hydrolase